MSDKTNTRGGAAAETSEFGLRRVLGLRDLVAVEIGQTVGAGVFILTGLAVAYTGGSLPLAYILAAVPIIFLFLAVAMLGSAVPTTGGTYYYVSRFFSSTAAVVGIWGYTICALLGTFPLYAVSCAGYLQAIWPGLPTIPTALTVLTILFVANVLGIVVAAAIQALMVLVLVVALAVFVGLGLPHIDLTNLSPFLGGGVGGLILASCLLTFTHTGSNGVIELGGEIKNPGRNIPLSLAVSVPIVVVFYVLIALVTVGVQPWAAAAGRPLTESAAAFMSGGLFAFFVIGGGVLAIVTSLNATFMFGTKSLMRMANDGWIPRSLMAVSERFATPHRLLTGVYLISAVSLLAFGENALSGFAALASIGAIIIYAPIMVAAMRLRRYAPKEYEAAPFKLKGVWYYVAPVIGILLTLLAVVMLIADLFSRPDGVIFAVIFLGLFAVGCGLRRLARQEADGRDSGRGCCGALSITALPIGISRAPVQPQDADRPSALLGTSCDGHTPIPTENNHVHGRICFVSAYLPSGRPG